MSKSQEIDEGLVEILDDFLKGKIHTVLDAELAIQSYLKKEGWVRLPGKYVVKKGCLVKID